MKGETAEQILTRLGLWPPSKKPITLQVDDMGKMLLRLALYHYKNDMLDHLTTGHEEFNDLLEQVNKICAS